MATLLSGLWPNVRIRYLRYNNLIYAFNGRDVLNRFDGENWYAAGFAKPTGISAAVGAAGDLTGTYQYYVTAANCNITVGYGRYVESLPADAGSVTLASEKGAITLPGTGASGQTHWVIYRNKAGDLRYFWRVTTVAVGTTTYADNTGDDSLETVELGDPGTRFPYERPPCFKHACIFGNRMLSCCFDEYNEGTVTVNGGDATLIDLAEATFPAGVVGCFFQADGDSKKYIITARGSTTQITLDQEFSGALSAADYMIYRDPSTLWYTEFDNMEAWGEEGEGPTGRNQILIGGRGSLLRLTGCYAAHGVAYVWTDDATYRVRGGTSDAIPLWVEPDPFLRDVGCVGADTVVQHENRLYWLDRKGPVAFDPTNGVGRIGESLGGDWIAQLGLDAAQLSLCAGGYDPVIHAIKWCLPLSGETECGYILVYDIRTGTWWPETDWTPKFYFNDFDGDGKPKLYSVVGRQLFRESEGRTDGVPSGTQTGTVTGYVAGTKTVTCAAATFYTTSLGLEDRWAHVYTAAGVFRGKSRIDSSTAHTLVLEDAISGTIATDIVYVGAPQWYWKTKTFSAEPLQQEIEEVHLRFALQGEGSASTVYVQDYIEGAAAGTAQSAIPYTVGRTAKKHVCKRRSAEYSVKVSGRTPSMEVAVRSIVVTENQEKKDATNG